MRRGDPWRRRRFTAALAALVLVIVLAGGGLFLGNLGSSSSAPKRTGPHHSASPTGVTSTTTAGAEKPDLRTFLGAEGVESEAVISENQLPGTTSWRISDPPGSGFIEGFSNLNYASVGQRMNLYVSTTAPEFHVVAYRMGYYGGTGAREVWSSPEITGVVQPHCPVTAGVNMVSCDNWSISATVPITSAFVQGDYLFKLIGSDNTQSYVLVTIWDPTSTATYLVMARSLTEEGWNTYGGYSYYQGEGPCTLGQTGSYPVCNRARIVSFDRPFAEGDGASDFIQAEYPLVEYMEQHGLDVAYCTDITVNDHPGIILKHRALLSLDHDETWTYSEREGAQVALDHGVNIAFFGAAAVLRHARLQPSPLGPGREEVNYRDETEDPLAATGNPMQVTGNTWSSPPANWPETGFVGQVYSGYTDPGVAPVPFVVEDSSAWIFKGTGLHDGDSVPGVINSDIDHIVPSSSMPQNIEVLGHSPLPLSKVYTNQGMWNGYTYSDMTYYSDPTSEGGVFDSGTVNWIYAITPCPASATSCPAPSGPADHRQPAVALRARSGWEAGPLRRQLAAGYAGGLIAPQASGGQPASAFQAASETSEIESIPYASFGSPSVSTAMR